jgi:hypothetical protein
VDRSAGSRRDRHRARVTRRPVWRRAAYTAAIAFHAALLLFGWGFGLWVVPAVLLLSFGLRGELAGRPVSRHRMLLEPSATQGSVDREAMERALVSELKLDEGPATRERRS